MIVTTARFANPKDHHSGWFAFYRFGSTIEIWFGHRYWVLGC